MIIAIANQKGGQGKTTTAQALATGCANTLAVDFDPQCNLTFGMGGNAADVGAYQLITGTSPRQTIQKTKQGDIIAASGKLAEIDTTFTGDARIYALRNALKPIKGAYSNIIIDCPPSLNTLLINALAAADVVIIPITADIYSLQGLYQLKQTIDAAQKVNKGLKIGGVVFTRYSTRTVIDRDLYDVITTKCNEMGIPVYATGIRSGVAIREAQTLCTSIFDHAPKSNPAIDYKKLIKEIGL